MKKIELRAHSNVHAANIFLVSVAPIFKHMSAHTRVKLALFGLSAFGIYKLVMIGLFGFKAFLNDV